MKRMMTLLPLLSLLLLVSLPVFAVSLGDELILSRLGDPVEIEIEVLQWEDMDLDRVEISAATREEYEVFDLTWLPVLEDLNFNLVGPDLDGDVRVLISSREPLNEPFLELLLVLRWPGGSLRREYVLLFDPPGAPISVAPPQSPDPDLVATTLPQTPPAAEPAATVVEEPIEPAPLAEEPAAAVAEQPDVQAPPAAPVAATMPVEPEIVAELAPNATIISVESEVVRTEVVNDAPAVEDEAVEDEPPAPPAAVAAEEPAPIPATPVDEPEPDARTQIAIEVETLAPQPQAVLDTSRRTYQVRTGDSLWNIARQFRPAGAGENLYQMLLSIHDLNRSSFINGNISLLKANAMLQIPSTTDIDAIGALTAEAEFDRRWEQGTQRFDAVQRGEAIPLFANVRDVPEEPAAEPEEDLPPGMEAPVVDSDDDALIMASATNVPQPLQIAPEIDAPGAAIPSTAAAAQSEAIPFETDPAPAVPEAAMVQTPPVVSEPVTVQTQVRVVTRAVFAAELETELAAMRARRQSAEAVAQQLQSSLQRAQADRAAQSSLFGAENLLLAGGAAALLAGLLVAVVVSLKIAGDLRLQNTSLATAALDNRTQPRWANAQAASESVVAERKEPHMPEMEVVELKMAGADTSASKIAAEQSAAQPDDDLFARMDDLLGVDANPTKNS